MSRMSPALAAAILASSFAAGSADHIRRGPRKGTMPNPERQSKAEQKRAKRARRNLARVSP
jgi:hypothetical protein